MGPGRPTRGAFDPRAAWAGSLGAAPIAALTAFLLLGVAVLLAYRGSLDNGLVRWDDDIYLEKIPQLQSWTWSNLLWMWTDRSWFYWHPVAFMDHACDLWAFGTDWRRHHLMSACLHLLNAGWVLVLACAFLGPRKGEEPAARPSAVVGAAFLAALLWALHPLRVESTAWLAEKKDLLCAFFSLGATAAWLGGRRGWTWAAFVLALASKPTAVALPAAWLVLDLALLRRPLRESFREKVPFLALGFAAVFYGAGGTKEEGRVSSPLGLAYEQRILTPLWGFAAPLVRSVAPFGLSPMEPQFDPGEIRLVSLRWGGSFLLLAAASWWAIKRGGAWLAAWGVYLALAAPVSGLRQLAGLATADRFSYLATLPLFLLAGAAILRWGKGAAAAALLLAGGLAFLSVEQVEVWRDPTTLWARVLREWPGRGPEPHDHLGAWWAREAARSGDRAFLEKSEAEFRASLRIVERNPTAHSNLGRILEEKGDLAGAEKSYRRSAELAPAFGMARMNLARLCARRGRRDEARRWYDEAVATGAWVNPALKDEVERLLRR